MRRPFSPSWISRGMPAMRVATTGVSRAIASSRTFGSPSRRLLSAKRSIAS